MTQTIEILEYTLPDYLACYLINGIAQAAIVAHTLLTNTCDLIKPYSII